jgi:hypothetical protein
MQDKTQNSWKQILENVDGFTGAPLKDKNAAWEKLHARLHKKTVNNLLSWHWVAAACLVVATITTIFLLSNKKQEPLITVSPAHRQPVTDTKKRLITEQKNAEPVSIKPRWKNKTDISYSQKNRSIKKDDLISNNAPSIDSINKAPAMETVTQSTLQVDSADRKITIIIPAKKKLRVVHINDLGQPAEESTADNKFIERHTFPLRINNHENYHSIPGNSANNGLILFKSRNFSN